MFQIVIFHYLFDAHFHQVFPIKKKLNSFDYNEKMFIKLVNDDILQLNLFVVLEVQSHIVLLLPTKTFCEKKRTLLKLLVFVGQVKLIHRAFDDVIQQDAH